MPAAGTGSFASTTPAASGPAQRRGLVGQTYQPTDPTAPANQAAYDAAHPAIQTYGTGGALVHNVGSYLHNLASDPGPAKVDNSPLTDAQNRSAYTGNRLEQERIQFGNNPNGAPSAGLVQLNQGQIDPVRQAQQDAIAQLHAAAAGQTPSAAELQAQQQGNRAAAQQFGMASALQGGLSPGAALRQASEGAAGVQADVANNNAILRAQEMAGARGQLVQGLSGIRGQEQDLAGQNAGLQQQGNLANLNSQLTTTGQNQDWQKALLSGQLQSNQTGANAAGALADANAKNAASANAYNSSYVQQGKQLVGKLFGG